MENNTIESPGELPALVKGYIEYDGNGKLKVSAHDDGNVHLESPALMGLYEYTMFGKVLPKKRGSRHIPGRFD